MRVRALVPSPFCSPWRHPVWRWKLRKLRRDLRAADDVRSLIEADLAAQLWIEEQRRFLFGQDA